MILTDLQHLSAYQSLHPLFPAVFQYVCQTDFSQIPNGKHEIQGEKIFVILSEPSLVPVEKQPLEAHKRYIDLHMVLQGEEGFGWRTLSDCHKVQKPYQPQEDYMLFSDAPTSITWLKPQQIAIVFPEDAHAPVLGSGSVRKIVVKIEV